MKVSRVKMFLRGKIFQLLCLIAIVLVIAAIFEPKMFSGPNIRQIMSNITITAVFVCGVAPLLMSGGIDFSGSAFGVCSSIFFARLLQLLPGLPWYVILFPALIFGALLGLLNSFFIVKLNLVAFIATMAMATVFNGLGKWYVASVPIPIAVRSFNSLSGVFFLNVIPLFFVVMLVMIAIYSLLLIKTSFGRSVIMCGGNAAAARLAGLNPNRIRTILYVNSGFVAAIGGIMQASQTRVANPDAFIFTAPHMSAFIATILGGVSFFGGSGSLGGAVLGVALMQILSYSLTTIGVPTWSTALINGMLLIVALTVDDVTRRIRFRRLGIKAGGSDMVMPGMSK